MSKIVEVAAALVFNGPELLITRRKNDTHLAGFWEFPGGKVKSGEDHHQALQRELMEEVGLMVIPETQVHHKSFTYPDRRVDLHFYRCRLCPDSPSAQILEVADLQWVNRHELKNFDFPEANDDLIHMLIIGEI